jgi:hypothetical protein
MDDPAQNKAWVEEGQAEMNTATLFHQSWQLAWLANFHRLVSDITPHKVVLVRTDLQDVAALPHLVT